MSPVTVEGSAHLIKQKLSAIAERNMIATSIKSEMASLRSSTSSSLRTTVTRTRPTTNCTSQRKHTLSSSTRAYLLSPKLLRQEKDTLFRRPQDHKVTHVSAMPQSRSHSASGVFEHKKLSSTAPEPIIHSIFEATTGTFQYIVTDPSSLATVIIDPVLDFDRCTSTISTKSADALLSLIREHDYKVYYILETHVHADHLSAASYLQVQLSRSSPRPQIGIGRRIHQVQKLFGRRYGVPSKEYEVAFDKLFEDDEVIRVGGMEIKAIHLPGHTPDHLGYQVGTNVFCGDSLFHPSIGTARTDFPGGSADDLWASAQRLLALRDETKIWVGHDYPTQGRESSPFMTVGQHKVENKHIGLGVRREEFVRMRTERDGALGTPRLLHQSLQINARGGRLPVSGESGQRMLSVPLKIKAVEGW